jgi:hypothetical protein
MMLDVAGGVLIAMAIGALFALGFWLLTEDEKRSSWFCMLLATGLALWIVIARWP